MSIRRYVLAAAIAVGLAHAGTGEAEAASSPLIGNNTEIEVVAPLGSLGLTAAPFGSAIVDASGPAPVFTFPITGGLLDTATGDAVIEHEGSGVALTSGPQSAFVGNFRIDTAAGRVFGEAAAFGFGAFSDVPLFELATAEARGIPLLISGDLADVFDGYFGVPGLGGETFGFARPDVSAIPLPAGAWLTIAGLGMLGLVRRRRRAAA